MGDFSWHRRQSACLTRQLSGQILVAAQLMPTPLILLAMAIFYLWIYMRRAHETPLPVKPVPAENASLGAETA